MSLPRRVLVANRGEIGVRIARTCVALGIEPVARRDAGRRGRAAHARSPTRRRASARTSTRTALVAAARASGADAVHPGYGFLAESAALRRGGRRRRAHLDRPARRGPPPRRRQARGEAHRRATPGCRRSRRRSPAEVGLPLLVKAAAGGGGRGMRIVTSRGRARGGARRPPRARPRRRSATGPSSASATSRVPRHVEVQLLADAPRDGRRARRARLLGAATPPEGARGVARPGPPDAVRSEASPDMRSRSRVRSATASAGTAEFLVDGDDVFFLELNGRIQVEHPVTEAVTGLDLVELQLRIAGGEALDPTASARRRARGRGAPLCRGSAHVPAAARADRAAPAARRASGSTPGSRRGTRSAAATTR